jgi:hypothetical protein
LRAHLNGCMALSFWNATMDPTFNSSFAQPEPIQEGPLFTPRVISGIEANGRLHLGNYFGAIRQHLNLQHEYPGETSWPRTSVPRLPGGAKEGRVRLSGCPEPLHQRTYRPLMVRHPWAWRQRNRRTIVPFWLRS